MMWMFLAEVAFLGCAVGLPPSVAQEISDRIEQKMAADRIPGLSVAIVRNGRMAWAAGFGFADVENDVPADVHTVYRSASLVKPITATVAMRLAEQDQLNLDLPVSMVCDHFTPKQYAVTTRQLLTHTAGIRSYPDPWPDYQREMFSTVRYPSVSSALEIFANDPLLFEPDTDHRYTTYGYNLAGCVIEHASGRSFMETVIEYVARPSGMLATQPDDPEAVIEGRASGYMLSDGGVLQKAPFADLSNKVPGGGLVTTAPDMARFAAAVMRGQLVSDAVRERMWTPAVLADGTSVEYGYGWGLETEEDFHGLREVSHGGMTPGVSSIMYLLPDRDFAVVVMANLYGVEGRTELVRGIAELALGLSAPTVVAGTESP